MIHNPLDKVRAFYKQNRRLPSYSEMLEIFGLSSKNSIYKLVQKWMDDGFVQKDGSNKLAPTKKFFAVPMLGLIKAGYPILAEENKNYVSLDEYLIEDPQSSFLLKVSGDSMVDAGIFDDDIVVIERKQDASQGDIVLAEIDREWTLKILRKDMNGRTYLEAANQKYPFFYPKADLKVHGIVKAVIRKFN